MKAPAVFFLKTCYQSIPSQSTSIEFYNGNLHLSLAYICFLLRDKELLLLLKTLFQRHPHTSGQRYQYLFTNEIFNFTVIWQPLNFPLQYTLQMLNQTSEKNKQFDYELEISTL